MGRRKQRSRGAGVSFFSFQDIIASVTGIMILITLLMTIQLISKSYASAQNPGQIQDLKALRQECDAIARQRDEVQKGVEEARQTLETFVEQTVVPEQKVRRVEDAVRALRRTIAGRERRIADKQKQRRNLEDAVAEAEAHKRALDSELEETEQKAKEERKKTHVIMPERDKDSKKPYLAECAADHIVVGEVSDAGILTELRRFHGLRAGERFVTWARKERDFDSEYFVLMVHRGGVHYYHYIFRHLIGKCDLGTDVVVDDKKVFEGS